MPDPLAVVQDLPLQVALVDHVGVDDPERADPGGRQVVGGGRSQAAGPDDEHFGIEQLQLPLLPHLGNQHVPAVALLLRWGEITRHHKLEAGVLPGAKAALQRGHTLEAHLLEGFGGEGRAIAGGAIGDDRRVVVRDVLLDP